MELIEKLQILADAAKYDVSCSSSGSNRRNTPGGLGNGAAMGICHSWSDDGRCVSLLKILQSNVCIYDCVYCVNRASNDVPRATFTPDEVARLTVDFYRRNYIEGLFLSSAVTGSPDQTMELLTITARKLRVEHRFNGYIHMKGIPGADPKLIAAAGLLVDRMSVNIELPSREGLQLLAPEKKEEAILRPMGQISQGIVQVKEERAVYRNTPKFVPAGQTTQLIVGATQDTDLRILRLSEGLYDRYQLKRVYYSAFVPGAANSKLPALIKPPLMREHRLYQADWLLRFYGFSAGELVDEGHPELDLEMDPKAGWALRHLQHFPVEINRADYPMLLRVPGIGVRSARRILAARRVGRLSFEDLKKIGVVLKRARYFITCNGKYAGELALREDVLRRRLTDREEKAEQLCLFAEEPPVKLLEAAALSVTGEI